MTFSKRSTKFQNFLSYNLEYFLPNCMFIPKVIFEIWLMKSLNLSYKKSIIHFKRQPVYLKQKLLHLKWKLLYLKHENILSQNDDSVPLVFYNIIFFSNCLYLYNTKISQLQNISNLLLLIYFIFLRWTNS